MHKIAPVVIALALLALATSAFAQSPTARYAGMGNVGIAASDDAGAIGFNPANLASLSMPAGTVEKPWSGQLIGTVQLAGDGSLWGLNGAAYDSANRQGIGAGFGHQGSPFDVNAFAIGYGAALKNTGLNWGLSLSNDDNTMINLGLQYNLPMTEAAPIKLGFVAADLFNASNDGPFYSVGAAFQAGKQLLIGADWLDVSDVSTINVGAEYTLDNAFTLRAGGTNLDDSGRLTLGAGYKAEAYKADLSWVDGKNGADDQVMISVGADF
ncbi:MAG TPA: hypothetical protein VGM19_12870 [Armatimonadota bacterium]|jgi:hypothetical protein